MHADIHKRAEVGHVGHHAFEDHPQLQVLEVFDAFLEFGGLELGTRVAARFFQLLQDVGDGRHAEGFVGVLLRVEALEERGVADQRADVAVGFSGNALYQRVGFRVDSRGIQRVVTVHDAQEAGGLFEGFFAKACDFFQRCTGLERTVFVAVGHDVLRQGGVEAGDAGQQRNRSGVYVHAHGVHAVFNHGVQAASQFQLRHVVLVLADADGFRIDLHQLGQWVLQAASDGHCATDRHVEVREFLGSQFRRGVHRSAGLGDHHLGHLHAWVFFDQLGGQLVGFTAGGAVADGNQVHRVLGAQGGQDGDGLVPLVVRHVGVNRGVIQQLAGGVDHGNLAAGAQARVEAQGRAWAGGCGQQQVVQVVGEYADGFGFGAVAQLAQQVGFQVGVELDLPGPAHDLTEPLVRRTILILDAELLTDHAFARVHGAWQLVANFQRGAQDAFVAAAENRQCTVGRHAFQRLVVFEVIAELGAFLFLAGDYAGTEGGFLLQVVAQFFQQVGVFGEALHEDVLGAFEGGLDVGHAFFGIDKACSFGFRGQGRVVEQTVGQLAEAGFQGDLALGAALLLVREVQVFEAGLGVGELDVAFQLRGQLALLFNAGEDADTPFVEFSQVAQALFQMPQLDIIEAAGDFFTVTGDEGHCGAFIQ
eukprot:gene19837-biopygen10937